MSLVSGEPWDVPPIEELGLLVIVKSCRLPLTDRDSTLGKSMREKKRALAQRVERREEEEDEEWE